MMDQTWIELDKRGIRKRQQETQIHLENVHQNGTLVRELILCVIAEMVAACCCVISSISVCSGRLLLLNLTVVCTALYICCYLLQGFLMCSSMQFAVKIFKPF